MARPSMPSWPAIAARSCVAAGDHRARDPPCAERDRSLPPARDDDADQRQQLDVLEDVRAAGLAIERRGAKSLQRCQHAQTIDARRSSRASTRSRARQDHWLPSGRGRSTTLAEPIGCALEKHRIPVSPPLRSVNVPINLYSAANGPRDARRKQPPVSSRRFALAARTDHAPRSVSMPGVADDGVVAAPRHDGGSKEASPPRSAQEDRPSGEYPGRRRGSDHRRRPTRGVYCFSVNVPVLSEQIADVEPRVIAGFRVDDRTFSSPVRGSHDRES